MSEAVDIVIGAKNQASRILDDVGRSTQMLATNVASSSEKIKVSFGAIAAPLAILGTAIAAFKGGGALMSFLTSSASAFGDSEDATRKLAIAIDLSGMASADSLNKHNALADSLQRTMNIEDELTKGLMAQASMLGVADSKLDDVTKAAIGLSAAMGTSLEDGLSKVRKALDGNFTSIEKQIPAIRALATEEQKFEAMLSLAERGLIQKAAASDSMSQADERAMLAIGELMESAGAAVLPLQAMAYEGIEIVVTSLNAAFGPAIKSAGEFFGSFKDLVASGAQILATSLVTAGTFIEVAWNNLGSVFEIVGASILLSLETMRADLEQVLTVTIPTYAVWFAGNFFNIMRDAGMAIVTVFSNLGTIIGEIFAGIWLVVTGQQSIGEAMENIGRAAGRGLLDGFEATTQALPEIAARSMTDAEKVLNAVIDKNSEAIASDFSSKLASRLDAVNTALSPKEDDADKKISKDLSLNKLDAKKKKNGKEDSTESILTATESRLLSRGRVDKTGEQVAQNTNRMIEQNDELKAEMYGMRQAVDDMNRKADIDAEFVT